MIATKIYYFAQFGIFADISGSRESQNSFLVCLLFSVDKLQTQNNTVLKFNIWNDKFFSHLLHA